MSAYTRQEEQALNLLARGEEEAAHGVLGVATVTVARAQVHATLALAAALEEQTRLSHGVQL